MLVFKAYIIHVNQISNSCLSTFLQQAAGISWMPCGMFRLFSCCVLFVLTADLWCGAAGWTLLALQGKQGSGLGKWELGFRLNHRKVSGAASLMPEVSWAGPVDFSLSFEYVSMCLCASACTFVHSALGPTVFGAVQVYRGAIAAWESFMYCTNWQTVNERNPVKSICLWM